MTMASTFPEFPGQANFRLFGDDFHISDGNGRVGKINYTAAPTDERIVSLYAFCAGRGQGKDPQSLASALSEFKNDASLHYFFCADGHIIVITQRPPTEHEAEIRSMVAGCPMDFRFRLLADLCREFDHELPYSPIEFR